MKKINTKSIQFKIILYTMICITVVGIVSNFYLFSYLNKIIVQKADNIDALYLDTIKIQMDFSLEELYNLAIITASHSTVTSAMGYSSLKELPAKRAALDAQQIINENTTSVNASKYLNRFMVFNDDGLVIQSISKPSGQIDDFASVQKTRAYAERHLHGGFAYLEPSIGARHEQCFTFIMPVFALTAKGQEAFVYMELSPDLFLETLKPYTKLNSIFVATKGGDLLIPSDVQDKDVIAKFDLGNLKAQNEFKHANIEYKLMSRGLASGGFTLYNCINTTDITLDNRKMTYTLMVVLASVLIVALGILVISSNFITRPLQRLIAHIRRMSDNDFSFNPEIEKTQDEIGEVGKVINEMCLSFNHLLKETVEISEEKRNIELDLLQSQVNPHFLYNTLDSIHWMAVIQKNQGICNITRSLSNLLKNMAKGFSQKVTLAEELKLLDDYVTIQSIRYMETFDLINNIDKSFYDYYIIKLTLQPLVENAIFHGIEPTGVYGTITLSAREDDKYLYISVEDSGVGLTSEEIDKLMQHRRRDRERSSMSGIGVANVHSRLEMVYGKPCGITIESEKNKFTRVTVQLLKETTI
ncbi:MAG: histidine kinase [Oscillospiraceae bacterium]